MTNVIDLPVITRLPLDPKKLLLKASERGLTKVVIMGEFEDGERYFASSTSDAGEVHWIARMSLRDLDKIVDDMEAAARR